MNKVVKKKSFFILSLVAICLVAIFLILAVAVTLIVHFIFSDGDSGTNPSIYYHPADYEENIFLNEAFLSFDRDLVYSNSREEMRFQYETDYETASTECKFFLDYFKNVTEGQYETHSSFYVDDFFSKDPKFTMQMIYEPYVSYSSSTEETVNGEKVTVHNFYVRYKIFKNNGTFRTGVASDSAVPQIYQLIQTEDKEYKILRILNIQF